MVDFIELNGEDPRQVSVARKRRLEGVKSRVRESQHFVHDLLSPDGERQTTVHRLDQSEEAFERLTARLGRTVEPPDCAKETGNQEGGAERARKQAVGDFLFAEHMARMDLDHAWDREARRLAFERDKEAREMKLNDLIAQDEATRTASIREVEELDVELELERASQREAERQSEIQQLSSLELRLGSLNSSLSASVERTPDVVFPDFYSLEELDRVESRYKTLCLRLGKDGRGSAPDCHPAPRVLEA